VLMVLSVVGQQVAATKGDVERALDLLKQARAAIGGETVISSVQNLSMKGRSNRTLRIPEHSEKQLNGDFEMNMILPDKLIRIEKLTMGMPDSKGDGAKVEDNDAKIKDVRVKVIRDIADEKGQPTARRHDQSEIAHYMLGLLLTPPPSFAASYNYAGEGSVDGIRAEIIEAVGPSGFTMKLYLDKTSHLPLMMSYKGSLPRIPHDGGAGEEGARVSVEDRDVVIVKQHERGEGGDDAPRIVIERKVDNGDAPQGERKVIVAVGAPEDAEVQVRFSNFRTVGGLLLPFTLTHLINGTVDTIWNVENYEINSSTINERLRDDMRWHAKQN